MRRHEGLLGKVFGAHPAPRERISETDHSPELPAIEGLESLLTNDDDLVGGGRLTPNP